MDDKTGKTKRSFPFNMFDVIKQGFQQLGRTIRGWVQHAWNSIWGTKKEDVGDAPSAGGRDTSAASSLQVTHEVMPEVGDKSKFDEFFKALELCDTKAKEYVKTHSKDLDQLHKHWTSVTPKYWDIIKKKQKKDNLLLIEKVKSYVEEIEHSNEKIKQFVDCIYINCGEKAGDNVKEKLLEVYVQYKGKDKGKKESTNFLDFLDSIQYGLLSEIEINDITKSELFSEIEDLLVNEEKLENIEHYLQNVLRSKLLKIKKDTCKDIDDTFIEIDQVGLDKLGLDKLEKEIKDLVIDFFRCGIGIVYFFDDEKQVRHFCTDMNATKIITNDFVLREDDYEKPVKEYPFQVGCVEECTFPKIIKDKLEYWENYLVRMHNLLKNQKEGNSTPYKVMKNKYNISGLRETPSFDEYKEERVKEMHDTFKEITVYNKDPRFISTLFADIDYPSNRSLDLLKEDGYLKENAYGYHLDFIKGDILKDNGSGDSLVNHIDKEIKDRNINIEKFGIYSDDRIKLDKVGSSASLSGGLVKVRF